MAPVLSKSFYLLLHRFDTLGRKTTRKTFLLGSVSGHNDRRSRKWIEVCLFALLMQKLQIGKNLFESDGKIGYDGNIANLMILKRGVYDVKPFPAHRACKEYF